MAPICSSPSSKLFFKSDRAFSSGAASIVVAFSSIFGDARGLTAGASRGDLKESARARQIWLLMTFRFFLLLRVLVSRGSLSFCVYLRVFTCICVFYVPLVYSHSLRSRVRLHAIRRRTRTRRTETAFARKARWVFGVKNSCVHALFSCRPLVRGHKNE